MKTIKSINDITEINSDYPFHFMEHLKQEFMELYEVLGDGEKLFEFNVPTELAFCVLQKNDGVKGLCRSPFDLEFVERFHVEQVTFYRIGVRFNDEVAIYYSLKGLHSQEDEDWLEEQSEWAEGKDGDV
ncbi:hypothetical protein [Neobacillus rhizophilus]|uniref:Uncharacterized protein n=1 Tax=Neobacillus rhizophilus TaxID=2833579 RepID=A0A942U397_9BACI|nr:hypothetical protein [Neobacillus rhizophilus]MBS4212435.1 hypothetical protein [Neobacillus rhizophilus]